MFLARLMLTWSISVDPFSGYSHARFRGGIGWENNPAAPVWTDVPEATASAGGAFTLAFKAPKGPRTPFIYTVQKTQLDTGIITLAAFISPTEELLEEARRGRMFILVDDEDRENEGDIIFAASKATPELMAFTIRYSSGVICVPMPGDMLERLFDTLRELAHDGTIAVGIRHVQCVPLRVSAEVAAHRSIRSRTRSVAAPMRMRAIASATCRCPNVS